MRRRTRDARGGAPCPRNRALSRRSNAPASRSARAARLSCARATAAGGARGRRTRPAARPWPSRLPAAPADRLSHLPPARRSDQAPPPPPSRPRPQASPPPAPKIVCHVSTNGPSQPAPTYDGASRQPPHLLDLRAGLDLGVQSGGGCRREELALVGRKLWHRGCHLRHGGAVTVGSSAVGKRRGGRAAVADRTNACKSA